MAWTTSYYHYDAVGTTRQLTDSTEAVTDAYLDDAFGNQLAEAGVTENPFRYVGKQGYYYDDDMGSTQVRARVYGPTIISWLSVDPLLDFATAFAPYLYVNNAPTYATDPSGAIPSSNEDIAYCQNLLNSIVNGSRQHLYAYRLPCATQLLEGFLSGQPKGCPAPCVKLLEGPYARNIVWFQALLSATNAKCNTIRESGFHKTVSSTVDSCWFYEAGCSDQQNDLAYAFHAFSTDIVGAAHYDCGRCCENERCKCTVTSYMEVKVADTYDFCSSLGNAKPRSLPWCGCLLEQEGIGKVYDFSCKGVIKHRRETFYRKCKK